MKQNNLTDRINLIKNHAKQLGFTFVANRNAYTCNKYTFIYNSVSNNEFSESVKSIKEAETFLKALQFSNRLNYIKGEKRDNN